MMEGRCETTAEGFTMNENITRFAELTTQIADLPRRKQEEFYAVLMADGICTLKELEAMQVGVAYVELLRNPRKFEAMQTALCEELYKEFTGKEMERG